MASRTTADGRGNGAKRRGGRAAGGAAAPDADGGTRDQIIQVAMELFLQRGYEGTSVKAIATEIGISTPALYWHFPSKQDIFFAAMEHTLEEFLAAVRGQLTADEPRERLSQLVRAHTHYQLDRQAMAEAYQATFGFRGLLQSLPAKYRKGIVSKQRSYTDQIREILAAGRSAGDFRFEDLTVTTFAVIQLCEFPNSWFNPEGRLSPSDVADLYVDLALRMVGASS